MAEFGDLLRQIGSDLQSGDRTQATAPSALQELAAYQTMTPEQQDLYWKVKRAAPIVNLGGTQAVLSPSGSGATTQSLPVTLKPEDQPVNAADKAGAVDTAKNIAERSSKFKTDQNLMSTALQSIDQQINKVDEMFDANGNLKPEFAANYGSVMGVQLPKTHQSTIDAAAKLANVNANAFIQNLGAMKSQSATGASGLGALSEKEGDKVQSAATAASDTKQSAASAAENFKAYRKELQATKDRLHSGFTNLYANELGGSSASPTAPSVPAAGTKIRVQNPQGKTGTIDASELPAALANGWKQL